ncbi:MAG: hypothetical protein AAF938_25730, partial [Myxococcota bacterium]
MNDAIVDAYQRARTYEHAAPQRLRLFGRHWLPELDLVAAGIETLKGPDEEFNCLFAWIRDPEGN